MVQQAAERKSERIKFWDCWHELYEFHTLELLYIAVYTLHSMNGIECACKISRVSDAKNPCKSSGMQNFNPMLSAFSKVKTGGKWRVIILSKSNYEQ